MGKDCHNCMTVCELWILMLWNVCKWCDYWLTCVEKKKGKGAM